MTEVTVGIDIGTSSVKAIAADGDGNVVGSARVPHRFRVPSPGRFEHDADEAWRRGPRAALAALGDAAPRGVSVAAMVPSLTAVDGGGVPLTPGLLYGDERGRHELRTGHPVESGELLAFLRWTAGEAPDAAGYWPAQAVANHALAGEPVLDTTTAATAYPLFDWTGWDPKLAADVGVRPEQLPKLAPTGLACGRIGGADGPALASGCIDAFPFGRRSRAASACRSTIRSAAPSSPASTSRTRRGQCDAPRSRRPDSSPAACSRRPRSTRTASWRRAGGRAWRSGCRRLPTP